MPQVFHVVRCCDCATFQVQQVKKVRKWSCKVCGQKQSLIKEYGGGSGADCRRHVQKLNSLRQDMDLKEFEENLAVLCQPEQQQQQQEYYHQQQLRNIEEDTTGNRWQKFLGSNPDTESLVAEVPEEDDILNSADQFDARNFQTQRRRPKWSILKSNPYRETISKEPDAFDERHILAPKRKSFPNAEQHCPPSQKNTGYWKMRKHRNVEDTPFTENLTDDNDFTDIQFVSNSGCHHGNGFKPASHVTASNPMVSGTTTTAAAAHAITTATTASPIKHNGVMRSHSKSRSSLVDHSPSKASSTLSSWHQKSWTGSDKVVQPTSSKSSKWSHFLSNNTNETEDSVGDSDGDDDDGVISDCGGIGGGFGGEGVGSSSEGVGGNGEGVSGGDSGGGVGGNGKNPGLVTQFKQCKSSQHTVPTNSSSLLYAKNDDLSFKKGYIQDFSRQRSNDCPPLTSVYPNSTVTSGTVTPKDLTDIENMFSLDENEFDFTF